MKFLKSLPTMFPVSVVTYLAMVPLAILHGASYTIYGLCSGIGLIFKNLGSVLLFPVKLPFMMIGSVIRNRKTVVRESGNFLASFVAFPSVFVRAINEDEPPAGMFLGMIPFVVGFVGTACSFANANESDVSTRFVVAHPKIFLAFAVCQVASVLYECGRAYFNYLTGANPSEPTANVAQVSQAAPAIITAPSDYLAMFNSIDDLKEIDKTKAEELGRQLASMQRDGKLTGFDLVRLGHKAGWILKS